MSNGTILKNARLTSNKVDRDVPEECIDDSTQDTQAGGYCNHSDIVIDVTIVRLIVGHADPSDETKCKKPTDCQSDSEWTEAKYH